MSWVSAAITAAGAVKGGLDAKHAKKKAGEHDKFRKQAIAMSPWSGMGDPGAAQVGNTDMMSGLLGGGMQGAMLGSMAGGEGAWGGVAKAPTAAPALAPAMNAGGGGGAANALGGNELAAQLGKNVPAMQSASAGALGAGAPAAAPWSGMGSQGAKHMQAANQMDMPTMGSGMGGLYNQMQGMDPYAPKKMFGGGI